MFHAGVGFAVEPLQGIEMRKEQLHCSKCRGPNDRPGQRYCKACHAAFMRDARPPRGLMSPEAVAKQRCRSRTKYRIKVGLITRQPCEKCASEHSEAHHPDYTNDMLVEWLCRPCHLAHHVALRLAASPPPEKLPFREAHNRWMASIGF